ncbi:hypothetical protein P7C70_g8, partial [Phenoliferia sp. Uapishka_3]
MQQIFDSREFRLTLYILLNFVRALTVVALLVGAGGEMVLLVQNLHQEVRHHVQDDAFYSGSPGISRESGGAVGFALGHIFSFLLLVAAAISELPLPSPLDGWAQSVWEYAIPAFGQSRGVGVVGFIMLLLGSLGLSQNLVDFPRIAAWLVFVLGWVNLLLGVTLNSEIHYFRSSEALGEVDPSGEPSESRTRLPAPATSSDHSHSEKSSRFSRRGSVVARPPQENRHLRFTMPSFLRPSRPHTSASASVYSHDQPQDGIGKGAPDITNPQTYQPSSSWSDEDRTRLGPMVQHRCNGCTVDVATSGPGAGIRGIGKLKATITQRFVFPSTVEGQTAEVDVDADCRLVFFVEKKADGWKTHFFKGFYEKDKATPVDPRFVPKFDDEKLASFPDGYRYLAYGQSATYKWLNGESIEKMKITLGV